MKAIANGDSATRHLRNSGDVFGVGKDNKLQFTCIPCVTAAGLFAAKSKEELGDNPPGPELKTVCIGNGTELSSRGQSKGKQNMFFMIILFICNFNNYHLKI